MESFSVWVGGVEVNDYEIETYEEAKNVAQYWRNVEGYDDVIIERIEA